jgi:hypothetical protein
MRYMKLKILKRLKNLLKRRLIIITKEDYIPVLIIKHLIFLQKVFLNFR